MPTDPIEDWARRVVDDAAAEMRTPPGSGGTSSGEITWYEDRDTGRQWTFDFEVVQSRVVAVGILQSEVERLELERNLWQRRASAWRYLAIVAGLLVLAEIGYVVRATL